MTIAYALLMKNSNYDWFVDRIFPTKTLAKEVKKLNSDANWAKIVKLKQRIVPCEVHYNLKTWDLIRKEMTKPFSTSRGSG